MQTISPNFVMNSDCRIQAPYSPDSLQRLPSCGIPTQERPAKEHEAKKKE